MHFWHGTPDVIVLFLTHQNIRSKISQKGVVSESQHSARHGLFYSSSFTEPKLSDYVQARENSV